MNNSKRKNFVPSRLPSFTKNTAEKLHKSQRAIQKYVKIGENIDNTIISIIKGTKIENNFKLLNRIAECKSVDEQFDEVDKILQESDNKQSKNGNKSNGSIIDFTANKIKINGKWNDIPESYHEELKMLLEKITESFKESQYKVLGRELY